jgi:hypothetical protein
MEGRPNDLLRVASTSVYRGPRNPLQLIPGGPGSGPTFGKFGPGPVELGSLDSSGRQQLAGCRVPPCLKPGFSTVTV